jgi:hypothetical protein
MDIKITSPTNAYNLKAGQLILTSDKALLVTSIAVNDYVLAVIDLKTGNTEILLTSGENITEINGSLIMKVFENDQAQLILP